MTLEGHATGDLVRVGGDARQRFHDARGYGRPREGDEIVLAPVEAAHLLSKGDLASVDGMGFQEFLARTGVVLEFVVYKDFRDRGFYLSPAREGWVDDPRGIDFVVHPRGEGPGGGVRHRVRVKSERESVAVADLGDVVLAVVDEDGEPTYLDTDRIDLSGTNDYRPSTGLGGTLHRDRVLLWDPPGELHDRGFYGQRLYGRHAEHGPLQLSLVEAAYLTANEVLDLDLDGLTERGRTVEGDRFDRRLRAYRTLRDDGLVPKSGFKFGADFRVYEAFQSIDDMGHSDVLIRVVGPDHAFVPRDLSLDVRLAGGVRKRMVFASTGATDTIDWLSVSRVTP